MTQTYVVRRAGVAGNAAALDAVLMRLRAFEERPSIAGVQWLHSYALREADGRFGLACVLRADGVAALQRHAELCAAPAREILRVAATVQVRPFAPTRVHLVRRRSGWPTLAALDRSGDAARRIGDEQMAQQLSWLRSYAVSEHDGTLGTVCLYQATAPAVLHEHAARVGMPADEIVPVLGRIVFRDESAETAAPRSALPT